MKKWALLFVCIAMLLILAVPGYAETPPTAPTIVTQPVDPKPVTGATVTLSATQQEYDGSEKRVSVTGVTLDGTALTAGTDYDVTSGTTGTDVGTYTVTVTGKGNYGGTATATWEIVPTMTFIGSIKWVDGGREHTTPPALTLYRTTGAAPEDPTDGTRVPNADPTWNEDYTVFTYAILREFDEDHNNYSYWVVEDTVDGYEAPKYYTKDHETGVTQETDRLENGGTVNNCIKQEKIKLTGIVTWEHGYNPGADRPKTATVHLQAYGADLPNKVITLDGTEDDHTLDGYGTYTPADVELAPTVENTWRFVFTGLDKYDSNGAEVIYTVREEHVANYRTTYDTAQRDITNTYNTNTLGDILKVRKAVEVPDGELAWTWGDDDKFVFGLYGVSNTAGVTQPMPSGSVYGDEVYKRIEVTKDSVDQEAGFGAVSFDTPGTYVYCVREMTPAESGTPRLPGMTCDAEAYTVTAVVDSDMRISVTVTNKAGQTIAPDGNNVVTMPFTNRFDANKVACAMAAGMVYVDPSKLDGDGRPLNVTGEVSGEFGFTMRPVGDNAADAPMPSDVYSSRTECGLQGEGAGRVYYAKNVNDRVPFEADAAHAIEFGAQQVGTYAYELAEIIPDDALYIGDGFWYNDVNETVYDGMVHTRTLTAAMENSVLTVTLDAGRNDKYLDPEKGTKYSDARNGQYQDAPAPFYSSIYPRPTNDEPRFCNLKQPRIDVTATKVWDDADNQDGKRPANVYFYIERDDGRPIIDVYGDIFTNRVKIAGADSSGSSFEAVWSKLPRYKRWDDGTYERITYKVFESANGEASRNSVPGYADQVITGDDEKGFIITNKRVPELRGVTVTKQWNDFDDRYHSRPEGVTFRLDQWKAGDSTPTASNCRQPVVASADGGWKATWLDLPARYGDASKAYAYTLREDAVPNYRAGDFVEGKASMHVQIPAGVTPLTDKLMVSLTDNDAVTGFPIELSKANNWTGTFEGVLTQSGADGYARYGVTVLGSGTGVDDGDLQKTVIRNYTITNTKNPAAIPGLAYNGKPQALVSPGVATGGAYWYAPGESAETVPDGSLYGTAIPTGTEVGTYYVWYKVVGDQTHNDTDPVCVKVTIAAPTEPVIAGAALVLDGTLNFRFYVALPEVFDPTGAHMVFTIHGRTVDVPFSEAGTSTAAATQGKKTFSCPVYSIEMAEPVAAVFHYTKDGQAKTVMCAASIRDYLDKAQQLYPADTKLLALIDAVRDYGHYIQPYLARIHGFTVGEGGYPAMPAAAGSLTPVTPQELEIYKTTWHDYDRSLLDCVSYYDTFAERTSLHVIVKLKSAKTVTATLDGADCKVTSLGGRQYSVEIPNIAANNLDKSYRVVFSANGAVICDIDVSALTYVRTVLAGDRSDKDEIDALTAFCNYCKAAKDYPGN